MDKSINQVLPHLQGIGGHIFRLDIEGRFPVLLFAARHTTSVDSKKEQIIQLVDVVLGAIGYFQNRHFEKQGAKKAKVALMKYVLDKTILNGAIHFTGKKFITAKSTKFNIWIFKPKSNRGWVKV